MTVTTGRQIPSTRAITDAQVADPKSLVLLLNGFFSDATNALSEVRPFIVRDVTVTIPDPWTDFTLANSWVAFNTVVNKTPGFYKDALGVVHLRGAAKSGTYGSSAIGTLPTGFCPPLQSVFPAAQSNATFEPAGRINIASTGAITAPAITSVQTGVSTFLSFDGITFEASDRTAGPSLSQNLDVTTRGLAGVPADVSVTSCLVASTSTPAAYPAIAWQPVGSTVRLTQITGLPPGTYLLRLLIVAG